MASRRECLRTRQDGGVRVDACGQRRAHAHAVRTLTQGLRELPALGEISRHNQLLMTMQGLADGLAMDIGIAIHVPAHPRSESQDAWHVERFDRHAVRAREGSGDFFVKKRHDAVENVD